MNKIVTISHFANKHWIDKWIADVYEPAPAKKGSYSNLIHKPRFILEEVATNAGYVVKDSTREDIRSGPSGTGIFIWDDISIDIPEQDLILLKLKYG